jgi:hypothetical protein
MVLDNIDVQETLARYIYSRNHYRSSDHTVKHSAFIPPKDKRLSIFRISSLSESEIWSIGGTLRAQSLLGRADIKALSIWETGLSIDPDDTPPRHANIVGWPNEDSAIMLKAIELAEKAQLHLN